MKHMRVSSLLGSTVLMLSLVAVSPVSAQMDGMMGQQQGGPGMMQMSGMMHDMADQMVAMSGEMSKGAMSAAQQKQMAERMRTMATMMDGMSGMMGKGMMMDADMQKRMDQMRKQMDEMMKMSAPAKK